MRTARPEGALLAGACAGIARTFGWNVWALRALFVIFLLVKTLWAMVAYGALALVFYLFEQRGNSRDSKAAGLKSPELAERSRRIEELERRFREMERREP